ncbi:MAG TPA: PaaI family thioesterase [Hyphomicrobiaceae bacterium]|jgi:uncharacterized protein (TIGR00369 family)
MSIPASPSALLDVKRIEELMDARFPQIHSGGRKFVVEEVALRSARVRMMADPRNIRPGGTIAGPAMFTLADFSIYVAVVATLGEAGFEAVTSNLNIIFLAKPAATDMTAVVKLIRLGRRLAVGEAEIYSEGVTDMVAHATATYALPIMG